MSKTSKKLCYDVGAVVVDVAVLVVIHAHTEYPTPLSVIFILFYIFKAVTLPWRGEKRLGKRESQLP